jgi:hypothetical protein
MGGGKGRAAEIRIVEQTLHHFGKEKPVEIRIPHLIQFYEVVLRPCDREEDEPDIHDEVGNGYDEQRPNRLLVTLADEKDPHSDCHQTVVKKIGEKKHLVDNPVLLEIPGELDRRLIAKDAKIDVGENPVERGSIEHQLRQPDALGEVDDIDRLDITEPEELNDPIPSWIRQADEQQHQWSDEKKDDPHEQLSVDSGAEQVHLDLPDVYEGTDAEDQIQEYGEELDRIDDFLCALR